MGDLCHTDVKGEKSEGERGRERENFRSPANGVGMRFEDLILHAFEFLCN